MKNTVIKTDCKYCKKPIVYSLPVTLSYTMLSGRPLYCPWCNRKLKNPPPNKTYTAIFKGRCEE